jgi:hypothetical protein
MSLDSIYQTRGDITNPNLKSVLAKLAVMNPQQLQAFAAANEDDPIMLSAAQAVHSKHKEFAEAMMAQQGGQMPPVNQQVVQNMNPAPQGGQGMPPQGMPPQGMPPQGMPPQGGGQLPEQQGIAQLPAPNIQNMAGGGIVAFADGGYTDEDVMSDGEPVLRMADGGVPRYQGVPAAMGGDGSLVMYPDEFAGIDEQIAARKRQMELEGAFDDYSRPAPKPLPKTKPTPASAGNTQPEDYRKQLNSFMPEKSVDPLAVERRKVSEAETKLARENLADYDTDMAKLGIAGVKQEERIGKREAELGKQKDMNTNMSIIEAGLAMMQSRGRGLAGIAEGAGVGTKMYASGLERLRAAQEKIDDARDGLDTLRRNEAFMTTRDRRALKTEVGKSVVGAEKDALKGMEMAYGIDKEDARTFFKTARQAQEGSLDRESRERVATIGANALTARANAAGPKGALTESQLATIRDRARDNITRDANYALKELQARQAVEKAGKKFDTDAWLGSLVDAEVERMLANTSRASTMSTETPTSGKLGSGTFDPTRWGQPQVVTPNK